MHLASGGSSRASAPSSIELTGPLTAGRFVFLASLGVLAVVLHRTLRYPLQLPGHHGLEFMALLVLGRLACTDRWAASLVALSAAATDAAYGGNIHAAHAMLRMAPGVGLDLLLMLVPNWRAHLILVPVAAGLAFALKPVLRFLLSSGVGMQFGSLRHGVFYPLSTHLLYGFAGALLCILLWRETQRRLSHR